ncbi:hypothetical protein CMI37_25000 [Candidatus Pacearchaeota archaeon]|nr:hypothetical protein [Candidatus Pacearchaeota archaeon]|tara:strand:- start:715 stop:924 length:210 start_codon:yes stop_codon:yes gene_type:complete
MVDTVLDTLAIKELLVKNGKIRVVDALTANATANVTISNVAPAAVGTATISAWLEIDVGGTAYYIPCWT